MKLKSAPARLKADGPSDTGEFEAIVSVFNNIDSWGDVVRPGAFKETIAEWKASANILPVLWSHRMDDPAFNIGEVLDLAELDGGGNLPDWVDPFVKENGGLWVKGRIDTGPDASPQAVHALRLLKARRVTQFSYAYDEVDAGPAKADGDGAWELRKLKVYEISPTQVGANELTELLAAKAAGQRTYMSVDSGTDDSGNAKGEEPAGVKPSSFSPESSRLLGDLTRASIALCVNSID